MLENVEKIRVAIFAAQFNGAQEETTEKLILAFQKRGCQALAVAGGGGSELAQSFDIGLLRVDDEGINSTAEQAANAAEKAGLFFTDGHQSKKVTRDKSLSAQCFDQAGLKQPHTEVVANRGHKSNIIGPTIAKPISGGRSQQIAAFPDALSAVRDYPLEEFLLQERIAHPISWRVIVADEQVVVSYKRTMPNDDAVVAAVSAGAIREYCQPGEDLKKLALDMAQATNVAIAGVDILQDRNGRLCALEINTNFGFETGPSSVGARIAEAVADCSISHYRASQPVSG